MVTNISLKEIFRIFFFILNNVDINSLREKFWLWIYTTQKVLLTIRYIKLIGEEEFTIEVLNPEYETFIVI